MQGCSTRVNSILAFPAMQIVPMKEFTLDELAKHNGSDPTLPMLLSIRGVVYDISTGKQFYGPDGTLLQQQWG